jgi:N-acetyl sugar amidotransferase
MPPENRVCIRCIMDTSDPEITFNEEGVCIHCKKYDDNIKRFVYQGNLGKQRLETIIKEIKKEGEGKEYDCIIGVSGGVDSSYTAYLVKKAGLKPLAVHLDNGWDSELAVKNIERLLCKLEIDLYTHVLDWEEFKSLQLAFLKASTPDSEIPSDHAIVALLYQKAKELGIRTIIPGTNIRTESHLPRAWSQGHRDWLYIKSINKEFGTKPLLTYPHYTIIDNLIRHRTYRWIPILNYIDYKKFEAMKVLENELDWKYYGGKHYESIYTRFYQGYILPKKFGFDKRRSHLSSLICSGETTRTAALKELEADPYPIELVESDKTFFMNKFSLTEQEFNEIMSAPPKRFEDYPSYEKKYLNTFWFRFLRSIYKSLG